MKPARTPELLSFITPAYNAAATVANAVESILRQELDMPFEVVVVDDASTDDTAAALRALEAAHADLLSVSTNERNLGAGATRNRAIRRARGDVIYMVDADNLLPPGTVQPQLELMLSTGLQSVSVERLDLFTTDPEHVDGSWEMVHHQGVSGLRELMAHGQVPAAHGNYLYTRELFEAVGGYREEHGSDSWIFGMKHVARGFDVAVAEGTAYFHRLRPDSYWVREELKGANDEQAVHALKEIAEFLPPDLRAKVTRLRRGDPVFQFLFEGAFTPEGELPGGAKRLEMRMRRKLGFAARRLTRRA